MKKISSELIKNRLSIFILIILASNFLISCTPSLENSLNINAISAPKKEESKIKNVYKSTVKPRVRVGIVNDVRNHKIVGEMHGRSYTEAQDSTKIIQMGIEKYFNDNDYDVVLFNAPTIVGELHNWMVYINPKTFTNKVEAKTEVILSLLDRKGRVIYRSIYSGSYGETGMFFSQADIERTLTYAMHYALRGASNDARMRQLIRENQ
ncbi:MAG: hypothetical protein ACOX3T_04935 [Bdellovibrionota bacterium]